MNDIELTAPGSACQLEGLLDRLNAHTGSRIKVFDGIRPGVGGAPTTLLVTVVLNDIAGSVTSDDETAQLTLLASDEFIAVNTGQATWARVEAGDGTILFDCLCGDQQSDATVRLSETTILAGGTVALLSAALGY